MSRTREEIVKERGAVDEKIRLLREEMESDEFKALPEKEQAATVRDRQLLVMDFNLLTEELRQLHFGVKDD